MLHSSSCDVYVPRIGHSSHPFTISILTTHRPPSLRFRPDLIWLLWSVFLLANLPWALLPTAHAASYEIVFDEGAFQYDSASSAENQDNKYLARVTVRKDGQILAKNLRGSTLPDAWAFYKHWNVDLKKTLPPTDTDVLTVFKDFEETNHLVAGIQNKGGWHHACRPCRYSRRAQSRAGAQWREIPVRDGNTPGRKIRSWQTLCPTATRRNEGEAIFRGGFILKSFGRWRPY